MEVPIYICSEPDHISSYERKRARLLTSMEHLGVGRQTNAFSLAADRFRDQHGYWRYNQVIAWLRLVACQGEMRADLYLRPGPWRADSLGKKKFHRCGTQVIAKFQRKSSARQIFERLRATLLGYEAEWRQRGYRIDFECLELGRRFIRWRALVFQEIDFPKVVTHLRDFEGTPLAQKQQIGAESAR